MSMSMSMSMSTSMSMSMSTSTSTSTYTHTYTIHVQPTQNKVTYLLEGQHDLLALGPVGHDLPQQVGIANDVRVGQPLRQGVVRPADAVEPLHHLLVDGTELGSGGGGGGGGCAAVRY